MTTDDKHCLSCGREKRSNRTVAKYLLTCSGKCSDYLIMKFIEAVGKDDLVSLLAPKQIAEPIPNTGKLPLEGPARDLLLSKWNMKHRADSVYKTSCCCCKKRRVCNMKYFEYSISEPGERSITYISLCKPCTAAAMPYYGVGVALTKTYQDRHYQVQSIDDDGNEDSQDDDWDTGS